MWFIPEEYSACLQILARSNLASLMLCGTHQMQLSVIALTINGNVRVNKLIVGLPGRGDNICTMYFKNGMMFAVEE